jgi:hypothetical protein
LIGLGVAGVLVYVLIVDFGISAGRIHHGVSVAGVDLRGLTEAEAGESCSGAYGCSAPRL